MLRSISFLALLAALAACDGPSPTFNGATRSADEPAAQEDDDENEAPVDEETGEPVLVDPDDPDSDEVEPDTGTGVPGNIGGALNGVEYDPATDTLSLDFQPLDASPEFQDYTRDSSRDVAGYDAYVFQEDPQTRVLLAFVARAPSGSVQGVAVGDGGQFNRDLVGGSYRRFGAYDPASGQVIFNGTYAGVIQVDTSGTVPPNPDIDPFRPSATRGDIRIVADFTNSAVNGGVTNREIVREDDDTMTVDLESIALPITDLDENGEFIGEVEFTGKPNSSIGTYGGIFAGIDSRDVAVIMVFTPIDGQPDILEQGVAVISR